MPEFTKNIEDKTGGISVLVNNAINQIAAGSIISANELKTKIYDLWPEESNKGYKIKKHSQQVK
jgi:hypothetical protein